MGQKIIIATIKSWNIKNAEDFKRRNRSKLDVFIFTNKQDLSFDKIGMINPLYIFFPHWSWMIPKQIYASFDCVVFHMTDLPFGRGGSPLQNLILRGIANTKICALKVTKGLDAGPVYIRRSLLLAGSAQNILRRASDIIFDDMMPYIIKNQPLPKPQTSRIVMFKRRMPKDSLIPKCINLNEAYDYIRMLDAEGYPYAFIENQRLRFELFDAKKNKNSVQAKVLITEKKNDEG